MKFLCKISLLVLLVIIVFTPQLSFAKPSMPDLDEAFEQFRSNYEKDEQEVRLAQTETSEINDRKVILKLGEGVRFNETDLGVQLKEKITRQLYVVQVLSEDDYWTKLKELQESVNIEYAEPDYVIETSFVPQDPLLNEQWYLERIGMQKAWNITRGSSDVTIAVIDSGVNANHPDLKGRVLKGYNFVAENNNTLDDNGHGTHLAGIIAANTNKIGTAGIDHSANILPLKVFCDKGSGSISRAIKGIHYAIDYGVDIINMSYVTAEKSKAEEEAIWKAHNDGIVLVAASGNDGRLKSLYPASYSPVISVAATNEEDKRASFSNYGNWIDLAAPGKEIYSTNYLGGYGILSGTSFSAPVVSALAALVKGEHPEWTPSEVEWALEYGADSVLDGHTEWNYIFGFGRVNAYQTLTAELPSLENDVGNVSSEAKQLTNGIQTQEKIDLPLDVDWFTFDTSKRSELKIELTNVPAHLDLVGTLYKYDDKKIESVAVIDQGGMGEDEMHVVGIDPGTYYLSAYDHYGRWSSYPYEVKVSLNPQTTFSDVKEYEKEIASLVKKEIIRGFPGGMFRPMRNVSRLQAVKMILREKGIDAKSVEAPNPGFVDITYGDEGYEEIAVAVELGFIKGKPNNTFDPYARLTRGQMASILVNAYTLEGTHKSRFKDVPAEHWAYNLVSKLAGNGITTGYADGTFRPDTYISRQHFALFMYRLLESEIE